MTAEHFVALWKDNKLTEHGGAQAYFDYRCDLLKVDKPRDPYHYCVERSAKKTAGGDGWADVWKRGFFGGEDKKPGRDLSVALKQLTGYALQLDNPPLLVVSDRYNEMTAGLKLRREALDGAVAAVYGWSVYTPELADEEILRRLLALNLERARSPSPPTAKMECLMSHKIMVVDDSPFLRQILRFTLQGAGYEVVEAVDGLDALRKLADECVHLLIADFNMPIMDGMELLRELHKSKGSLPVLLLSSKSDPGLQEKGLAAAPQPGWSNRSTPNSW